MSDLKICRICLVQGVKMYDRNQYHLKQFYEEIMGKKMNENDELPLYFCYECAAMLHKFHKFKEKCYMGEEALQRMTIRGPITLSSITLIYRQNKNLQSTIHNTIMNKKIRTCLVKHKTVSKRLTSQNKKDGEPEIEIREADSDSDNYLDDKQVTEIEIKNEIIIEDLESIQQEDIDKETTKLEEEIAKTGVENEKSIDDNATSDFFDDRMLSDNEEINTESPEVVTLQASETEQIVHDVHVIDVEGVAHVIGKTNDDNTKELDKGKTKEKGRKFATGSTYSRLDPEHWLKISLSEEDAMKEFHAKAQDQKYLLAAYRCTDCYKSFSKEDMLTRHLKLRHCESKGPKECRFCKMRFKINSQLTTHITQHLAKYQCLRCDTICPLETTAIFHNAYHNGVINKCKHCGEEFRHPSTYYTHLRTHRSEHICTLCGASFVSAAGLNIHKKCMHVDTVVNPEEEVNTYCEKCDIKFETRKAFEGHIYHSAKHVEGVEYLAGETPGPSIPKRRRTHFKTYRISTDCPICNITFPSRATFVRHRLAEHKGARLPGQRYICEICGISLAINSVPVHLKSHQGTHKGTQQKTQQKPQQNTQQKVYPKKKANCPICSMEFTTKASMKRHQVTHTGEKPFKCTLCEKRFTQKTGVVMHYRTIHLNEPYPKRDRRKKAKKQDFDDFGSSGENSDENLNFKDSLS